MAAAALAGLKGRCAYLALERDSIVHVAGIGREDVLMVNVRPTA